MNEQQGKLIASTKLTEENVRHAIVQFLLKNDEFSELVGEKKVIISTDWQVSKWSDPNAFVHVNVVEPINETIAAESTEESSEEE
jgi:hypothetical protein